VCDIVIVMRTVMYSIFVSLVCIGAAHGQSRRYISDYNGTEAYYEDDNRDPYYDDDSYEIRDESRRSRVVEERAHRRHVGEATRRDEAYTDVYESNVRKQERENIIDTVKEVTEAVNGIAASAKFIENLF